LDNLKILADNFAINNPRLSSLFPIRAPARRRMEWANSLNNNNFVFKPHNFNGTMELAANNNNFPNLQTVW